MFLDKFRRFVIGSQTGLTLFYAIGFFITMTLFITGVDNPTVVIFSASVSLVFGMWMASKFHKDDAYFVQNIQNNKYDLTVKYNRMFKKEEVPENEAEKAEYLEHLVALEQAYSRNRPKKGNVAILAFFFILFLFTLSAGVGIFTSIIFAFVILYIAYGMFRARTALQRIARVKESLGSLNPNGM